MSNQSFAHLHSYVFHKQSFIARYNNLKPGYLFATAMASSDSVTGLDMFNLKDYSRSLSSK